MGGEPTFVSIDDFEAAEWNTAAVGPTKRGLADKLIRRLRDRFAPGGFLHYGQGKWYPGETLPRWTFSLYWRRDGKPIWRDDDAGRRRRRADRQPTPDQAGALLRGMADRLGVDEDMVVPAYEDPAEWMLKEGNLPENVTPENSKLKDPEERHRIARVFERGLTEPSGYRAADPALAGARQRRAALAVARSGSCGAGTLFLVPGDSPVGYRLPLGALPYVPPAQYPYTYVTDPDGTARTAAGLHARATGPSRPWASRAPDRDSRVASFTPGERRCRT